MYAEGPDEIPTSFGGEDWAKRFAQELAKDWRASVRAIALRMGSYNQLVELPPM